MRAASSVVTVAVGVVCLSSAGPLRADFYDRFDDGEIYQDPNDPCAFDPNLWDIDNPHWTIHKLMGDSFFYEYGDGWLRMWADAVIVPFSFMGATVDDGDPDPNTSNTMLDDSQPHYILFRTRVPDPNWGGIAAFVLADPLHWVGYNIDYQASDHVFEINYVNGIDWARGTYVYRYDVDEANGFWICLQYDGYGDPNTSYVRASCWNGGKWDWSGVWDASVVIATTWDQQKYPPLTEGRAALGSYGSPVTGFPADTKFDDIEFRVGVFTNVSHTLSLTAVNAQYGTVTIDPDWLADPNDPDGLRAYTNGTELVLVAEPDVAEGRGFKAWKIYEAGHSGDPNFLVQDTNAVLYLTMDRDWEVQAVFKCSSSSALAPVGAVLLLLGSAVVLRRLT